MEARRIARWTGSILQLWDAERAELLVQFGSPGAGRIAVNPAHDRQVAVSRQDGSLDVWDFAAGRRLLEAHTGSFEAESISFSPDGKTLASGGLENTIRIWDGKSFQAEPLLEKDIVYSLNSLSYSPDGQELAAGRDQVMIFDSSLSGEPRVIPLTHYPYFPMWLAYSPDGSLLAANYIRPGIEIYRADTGQLVKSFTHKQSIPVRHELAFSPDGKMLAAAADGVWDVETGAALLEFGRDVTTVAFSPDQCLLAAGLTDRSIHIWDLPNRRDYEVLSSLPAAAASLAFSRDGRLLYTAHEDGSVVAWGLPGALDQKEGPPQNIRCSAPKPPTPTSTPSPTRTALPGLTPSATLKPTLTATATPSTLKPALKRNLYLAEPHFKGEDVLAVQRRLAELNYREIGIPDGDYGPKTDQAVRRFQMVNGLSVDGILGAITWEKLFSASAISG